MTRSCVQMVGEPVEPLKEIRLNEPYLSVCKYIEETLAKHGFEAWLIGGSVRDLLIEGKLSDLDYTTNAKPEQVQKVFPRTVPVGIKFGTVLVLHRGQKVEITTYRADADYVDGRRPSTVEFAKDLATDIKRRDFTVNGLAYSVSRKELKDHCGGLADLEKKILRTIGDPVARFTEDGLRPIRGCRIAAKLGFQIEAQTLNAMQSCVAVTAKVAPERFFDEWRKTLRMPNRRAFWENLLAAGIIKAFLPHIAEAFQSQQNAVFLREISLLPLRSMADYAAVVFRLLHVEDLGTIQRTLKDTRFPTSDSRLCLSMLQSPLFDTEAPPERQSLKVALSQINRRERKAHMRFFTAMLATAMRTDKQPESEISTFAAAMYGHYRSIRRSREALDIADLAVTGTDIEALGIKGREVGETLAMLLHVVVDKPHLNTKDDLLRIISMSAE